jgi:hypothetical protein
MSTFCPAVPLVGRIVVNHPHFEKGLEILERHLKLAQLEKRAHLVLLSGDTGAGKSFLLTVLVNRFFGKDKDPYRLADGLVVKAAVIEMPPKPTPKSILEEMLVPYKVKDFRHDTEGQLKRRVTALIKECQTALFAIEEVQHLKDQSTESTRHHVDDIFKVIHDKVPCLMILSGIAGDLESVVASNKQLKSRVRAWIRLPHFDWRNKGDRAEFEYCLREFRNQIQTGGRTLPDLAGAEWNFRLYCATGGIMRLLANFLEEVLAIAGTKKEITLEDFAEAYSMFRFRPELKRVELSPFSPGFLKLPRKHVLEMTMLIGKEEPVTPPRRARSTRTSHRRK